MLRSSLRGLADQSQQRGVVHWLRLRKLVQLLLIMQSLSLFLFLNFVRFLT